MITSSPRCHFCVFEIKIERTLVLETEDLEMQMGSYLMIALNRPYVQKRRIYTAVLGILCLGCGVNSQLGFAQTPSEPLKTAAKNWVVFAIRKDSPAIKSEDRFESGFLGPFIGYRHKLEPDWIMGVNYQLIKLKVKQEDRFIWLQTFGHEALRSFRLYHPWYLGIGSSMRYFIPSIRQALPVQRDDEFGVEVGFGASGHLIGQINNRFCVDLGTERWRGVMTNRFHFWSVILGVMLSSD